jgi:hypothetical protein
MGNLGLREYLLEPKLACKSNIGEFAIFERAPQFY